jgi:capsular polysaccharide export protein
MIRPPRLDRATLGDRDPFSGSPIAHAEADAILAAWDRIERDNADIAAAAGMAWWKRDRIARFLWTADRPHLRFARTADDSLVQPGGVAVWPSRIPPGLADRAGERLIRVEDGFIRSIGLGADLHPPLSIVVDRQGIYYDPTRPSDLETILQTAVFDADLLARAEALRDTIVTRGISKYQTGAPLPMAPPRTRRTVLVPGQVEDDASVRLGGAGVAGNLDLLARARAAEPDAHILFKPHPDVDAGHRVGRVDDAVLLQHADEIVRGEPMPSLLARVDAVHVLTSLTGFEALLRGLEVIVHGQPFFAGWGLTRDLAPPIARRTRRLSLAELIAGALILYPRYLDPVTQLWCPPEVLLQRFADGWRPRLGPIVRLRRMQGRIARALGTVSR